MFKTSPHTHTGFVTLSRMKAKLSLRFMGIMSLVAALTLLVYLNQLAQRPMALAHASPEALNRDVMTSFDVVIVGSEPEGVIAAVAAAREGASTLLMTHDARIGGLFVTGEMNSLDLRQRPLLQRGLFEEWWTLAGRGTSFDVLRAEAAFNDMLAEAGVVVSLSERNIAPVMAGTQVIGVSSDSGLIAASQVIDATSEADIAAAAGARYTMGFESIGVNERMVDTLVFRIEDVDWPALQRGIRARGRGYAEVDDFVAWGHFGGYPAAYQAVEPGIRLRGLNLGRQEDGSVLVNALLIYGVDPFDPESIADGFARAEREAPRIIGYLSLDVPGFENARYGGVAQTLYIRQTRHIVARCMLTVEDVMGNVVTNLDVAAGGYPLDVQTLTPHDNGFVYGVPEVYGAQLCVAVPYDVDNLWVAGKSAGYDPLAASSARVVPFGMAMGHAIGIAAARVAEQNISPHDFIDDLDAIATLRATLRSQGAYLAEVRHRDPAGPHTHPFFDAYWTLMTRGLALGGYENDPRLDEPIASLGYVFLLSNVAQRFLGNSELGRELLALYPTPASPLTPGKALLITRDAACLLDVCVPETWAALQNSGLAPLDFPPDRPLTRGEAYALAVHIAKIHETQQVLAYE